MTYNTFTLPKGSYVEVPDLIYNCHSCKRIFSPIKATLYPTDRCEYYNDVWSRLFYIIEIEEDKICDCRVSNTIFMYDKVDPMTRKFGE